MSSSSSGVRRCHHIKANGVRCGSPALRQHHYCFFHQRMRLRMAEAAAHASGDPREIDPERIGPAALDPGVLDVSYLPVLEDANSVQCALMIVLQRIFDGTLDRHRASLVLYGLQIASSNLKNVFLKTFKDDDVIAEIPKRTSAPPPPLAPDPQFTPDPRQEAAREAYRARMAEIDRRYADERRRNRPAPRPELPDFVRHPAPSASHLDSDGDRRPSPADSPCHPERVATEPASDEPRDNAVAPGVGVGVAAGIAVGSAANRVPSPADSPYHPERVATEQSSEKPRDNAVAAGLAVGVAAGVAVDSARQVCHPERVATEQASDEPRDNAVAGGVDVGAGVPADLASTRRAVGAVIARELPKIAEAQPKMMRKLITRTKIRRVPL